MQSLKLIASLMSVAVAVLGLLGLVSPALLVEFGRSLAAPPALYAVAIVRLVFGALLISVARPSRAPRTLRVLGAVILVAGLATPFFVAERFGEVVASLSGQWLEVVRAMAVLPLLLGAFLVYAINSKPHPAA
jgi:hypothetical protein